MVEAPEPGRIELLLDSCDRNIGHAGESRKE